MEDLDGRTSIVHQHFKARKKFRNGYGGDGPYEVLQSLPTIDSERVRDAAYAFRKRTSCADDHLVIKMLRELDQYTRETLASVPVQTAEPSDGGSGHDVGTAADRNGQEKEWQTHNEWFPPDCHAADNVQVVLKSATTVGGPGKPHQVWPAARSCPGRQAHEVVFILGRMVVQGNELRIPIFVMDCDVAAACSMEALKVPPVLVAAWIREYRRSETHIKLDDIFTRRIRRTRSVPANVSGNPEFCIKKCQEEKWELPVDGQYMGLLLFTDNCWLIAVSPAELRCMARAWNELLVCAGLRIAWKEAVWCTSAPTVWWQILRWRTR